MSMTVYVVRVSSLIAHCIYYPATILNYCITMLTS